MNSPPLPLKKFIISVIDMLYNGQYRSGSVTHGHMETELFANFSKDTN
jgi:hypothetical protein